MRQAPLETQEIYRLAEDQVKPSVVGIVTYNRAGEVGEKGSGFFLHPWVVASDRHLFLGAGKAEIVMAPDKIYPVRGVVGDDKEAGIILAEVEAPVRVNLLEPVTKPPKKGEYIYAAGFPTGGRFTVTGGTVVGFEGKSILYMDSPIPPGCEGGPAISQQGEVTGIITLEETGEKQRIALGDRLAALEQGPIQTLDQWNLPLYSEVQCKVGESDLRAGNFEKALTEFQQALRLDYHNANAHYYLGILYTRMGRSDDAMAAFNEAVYHDPKHAWAHYHLARMLLTSGDRKAAVREYKTLKKLDRELARGLARNLKEQSA